MAIKIIQRFSKKRRLGKVTVAPEGKTKREIAILKKVRHPNVVGLLEIIDDPELKKIYMVLEYVELGEIQWRTKGSSSICYLERLRVEKEMPEQVVYHKWAKIKFEAAKRKRAARAKLNRHNSQQEYWSLEHGATDDEGDMPSLSRQSTQDSLFNFGSRSHRSHTSMVRSTPGSRSHSRAPSRAPSRASSTAVHTPMPTEFGIGPLDSDNEDFDDETPGPLSSLRSNHSSASALGSEIFAFFNGDPPQTFRGRSPSMADSIISHMSSVDGEMPHDAFFEDYSYVPCFTIAQARSTFRDTVLGLEYLHYQGIVHRDIKPANLLWTRDHRVKISDFGVSYFGRPIRDGETEEYISESDAHDFDDDLELAKTVGTPAFFAPELCYTDLDVEQPKVTEQIDVWSLGVTLYCLIFARIPFLAEDEYKLFRAIAHQEVYIPKQRLKPVHPKAVPKNDTPPFLMPDERAFREDDELAMEDIDDELHDLIRRMLIKDPAERMKLREVKRHPWVLRGIDNVIGWLDDTDPSRKTAGRRIQVDDKELERAVVPITFLERARSVMKKAVAKVTGTSRRRAASSANSSGTDIQSIPATPMRDKDARRASMKVDESYFAIAKDPREHGEHPLAQSVTCSPEIPSNDEDPFAQEFLGEIPSTISTPRRANDEAESNQRPSLHDRTNSTAASIQTVIRRLSHTRSFSADPTSPPLPRVGSPDSSLSFTDHKGNVIRDSGRTLHDIRSGEVRAQSNDGSTRARSTDRALFNASNKHSEPSVATSNAVAHAVATSNLEQPTPKRHLHTRSIELSPPTSDMSHGRPSPHPYRPSGLWTHQQSASASNVPHMMERMYAASITDNRPSTANRTPEGRTPAPRVYHQSTPETFARAQETLERRRRLEQEAEEQKERAKQSAASHSTPTSTCPPSPDDDAFLRKQMEESKRTKSSSSVNSAGVTSPVTLQSEVTSPISSMDYSSANLASSRLGSSCDQFFASDPSLPTLVSGASSVSADHEGDFLAHPGVVQDVMEGTDSTPDTLTPPSLSKESSHELDQPVVPVVADEDDGYNADGDLAMKTEDDDSDSDEGLTMSRKKRAPPRRQNTLVRRDTNTSIGSAETAKKVSAVD